MRKNSSQRPLGFDVPVLLTVLVLALVVVAAGFVGSFSASPVLDTVPVPIPPTASPDPTASTTPETVPDALNMVIISGDVLAAVVLILVIILLAVLVRFLMRLRPGPDAGAPADQTDLARPGTLHLVDYALPTWVRDAAELLATEAESSDVVIRCWLEFERLCGEAGAGRRATQTSSDFAAAASSTLSLPRDPLLILNRLYQRARFGAAGAGAGGGVRLTAADRAAASASIAELAAAIRSRREVNS